jgi:glycine/D-amino acid oxidase-like deaminating enzyme
MENDHYDILVVGSGPGGATTAARVAETGKRRCSGCCPPTSARSGTRTASHRPGRWATTTWGRTTPGPSICSGCTAGTARTRSRAGRAGITRSRPCSTSLAADQPVMAARVEALRVGKMIPADAQASQLRDAAAEVPAKASCRQAARRLAGALANVDGAATAASVPGSRLPIAGDPKTTRTG